MRRRWPILLVLIPLYAAFMMWLITVVNAVILASAEPQDIFPDILDLVLPWRWKLDEPVLWMFCGIPAAALVVTQVLFLLPIVRVRPPRSGRARSLRVSLIMAALIAALLTGALACGIFGVVQLMLANSQRITDPAETKGLHGGILLGGFLTLIALSWIMWSIVLFAFARRRLGRGALQRVIGILLGSTIAEVIVVLPLDIMVRRRTDCYCGTGSFWTLIFSAWALMWLTGPGIIIAIWSKRRDPWWETHCEECGYEKGPSPGESCPECGQQWRDGTHAKPQAAQPER